MISKLNLYKESILVPRNLEGRQDKLRKETIKLLGQEVIEGNFILEEYMLDIPSNLIKVKTINGNLECHGLGLTKLPEWFKNLTVNGHFKCSGNYLTTLENSPKIIEEHFYCSDNELTSLKGCTKIINGYFFCRHNKLTSLENGPELVKGEYWCYGNAVILERPTDCIIHGNFKNI